jgi:superfamily II DNA or RNA helicase
MSISINLCDLNQEFKDSISKELMVNSAIDFSGYSKKITIYPYIIEEKKVYLPFYYGIQKFKTFFNDRLEFSERKFSFTGELRDYQLEVVNRTIERFNQVRTFFIAMATGKGKTLTSLYIASRIKLKVCVLLFRLNLFDQWEQSIKKVIPSAKIQILDAKNQIEKDIDFYLINPITVLKRNRNDFSDIGLLIADEAHALCSEKLGKSFLWFCPKYCLGLSATPERTDQLDQIINLHFGFQNFKVPLWVDHVYYIFKTNLVPEEKKNSRGDTDWNAILNFQATHPERNNSIVKICKQFKDRNILILCKRQNQTKALTALLQEQKESVDYTTGTKKKFNLDARILVSTYSKSGVGFDHPKLDMMIIASDVEENFEQYFGRCVRREDVSPIFVDLVDKFKSLENHARTRKVYSLSVGGKILDFHSTFPNF